MGCVWNGCRGTGVSTEGSLQVGVGISPPTGKQKGADGAAGEEQSRSGHRTCSVEGISWVEDDFAAMFCEQIPCSRDVNCYPDGEVGS